MTETRQKKTGRGKKQPEREAENPPVKLAEMTPADLAEHAAIGEVDNLDAILNMQAWLFKMVEQGKLAQVPANGKVNHLGHIRKGILEKMRVEREDRAPGAPWAGLTIIGPQSDGEKR